MEGRDARWFAGPLNWLELSRTNLLHNLAGVRALVGRARIMAVVKANAYGAGAVEMARVLAGAGVDAFGVATVAEGVELRQAGIAGPIVCLAYFAAQEAPAIFEHDLTPSLYNLAAARWLAAQAHALGRRQPVWIKVDTGLSRLGVPYAAVAGFMREVDGLTNLQIAGVFSTLTENPARDLIQVQRLLAVRGAWTARDRHPGRPDAATGPDAVLFSLASSNGILSLPASYLDIVRPGIVLHGLEPSERDRLDMRLVMRADLRPIAAWKARVADVRLIDAGEQIGYGIRPALAAPAHVACLAVGWADGYPAAMNQGGAVLIAGRRCPVLAVSANTTLVDVAPAPGCAIGAEAVLLGRQGAAEMRAGEVAQLAGGNVYRLLAAMPRSTPRIWT